MQRDRARSGFVTTDADALDAIAATQIIGDGEVAHCWGLVRQGIRTRKLGLGNLGEMIDHLRAGKGMATLFTWSVAGADPAPHWPSLRTRLAVLFLAGAAHATPGKLMYAHALPRGAGLAVEEIEAAAKLMCYGGDIAELALAVMLFITWLRMDRRATPVYAASGNG